MQRKTLTELAGMTVEQRRNHARRLNEELTARVDLILSTNEEYTQLTFEGQKWVKNSLITLAGNNNDRTVRESVDTYIHKAFRRWGGITDGSN